MERTNEMADENQYMFFNLPNPRREAISNQTEAVENPRKRKRDTNSDGSTELTEYGQSLVGEDTAWTALVEQFREQARRGVDPQQLTMFCRPKSMNSQTHWRAEANALEPLEFNYESNPPRPDTMVPDRNNDPPSQSVTESPWWASMISRINPEQETLSPREPDATFQRDLASWDSAHPTTDPHETDREHGSFTKWRTSHPNAKDSFYLTSSDVEAWMEDRCCLSETDLQRSTGEDWEQRTLQEGRWGGVGAGWEAVRESDWHENESSDRSDPNEGGRQEEYWQGKWWEWYEGEWWRWDEQERVYKNEDGDIWEGYEGSFPNFYVAEEAISFSQNEDGCVGSDEGSKTDGAARPLTPLAAEDLVRESSAGTLDPPEDASQSSEMLGPTTRMVEPLADEYPQGDLAERATEDRTQQVDPVPDTVPYSSPRPATLDFFQITPPTRRPPPVTTSSHPADPPPSYEESQQGKSISVPLLPVPRLLQTQF